jgi:hypothetical protein
MLAVENGLPIQVSDLQEIEGLIRSGGTSGVGSGNRPKSAPQSQCEIWIDVLFERQNRKRWMTAGFVFMLFILIVLANMGDKGDDSNDDERINANNMTPQGAAFMKEYDDLKILDPMPVNGKSNNDLEEDIVIVESTKPPESIVVITEPPEIIETETQPPKPIKPRFNSKIPKLDPDIEAGPIDDEKRNDLADKWGNWHFWDGDEAMRPKEDYLTKYLNRDIPGDDFPNNSWQTDAVYVNHFLDDATKLIDRATESIFTEYGHGKPLPPEGMASRMTMFHWEKLDLSTATEPPPEFRKRGQREIGGWTTKKSFDGLVRRLLHAMLTQDTFTVVLAGHSAAQGQGNFFRQSYIMQFHRIMKPIFERLGVKLITRNMSQGGMGTLQNGMGAEDIYGKDIDLFLWDSGMTENGAPHHIDLVLRQVLLGGNRVPVLWGGPFELLKMLHEEAGVDVGDWGTGFIGLPETTSEEQALTLPYAARNMKCSSERQDLCGDNRFSSTCWIDRPDGIVPKNGQLARPKGQVKWHPGWRAHQLTGRVIAFSVLEALEVAVNKWMDGTMTGQPLDDDYWHVTGYYNEIRSKVQNLDPSLGYCSKIANNNELPSRMCYTPIHGRTQYTPRANYEETALTSIVKPTPNGYVPEMGSKKPALYDGPDVHIPAYDIPEGEVDVLSIVMNRRRLESVVQNHQSSWYNRILSRMRQSWSSPVSRSTLYSSHLPRLPEKNRRLDDEIVPGEGWDIALEPQGFCDGTYDAICAHASNEECFLLGHHDGRGAIVGNEYAGWLVMTLKNVTHGIIVIKIQTWHIRDENPRTRGWNTVNGVTRRLGDFNIPNLLSSQFGDTLEVKYDSSLFDASDQSRHLKMRSYDCPPLPETFAFDYAINGKITSLNNTEFIDAKKNLQRVVETVTLLDDPNFTTEGQDVEVAIRLRGSGPDIVFGISHVYWA